VIVEEIPAALDDERLDRIVALIASVSRSEAAAVIDAGGVTVDGAVATAGKVRIRAGQVVTIDPETIPVAPLPEPDPSVEFGIVYLDEHLAVIDKPAGLVVHPGAGNPSGTLVNGLLARFPEVEGLGDPIRPGIVHRLDVGTSGLMVVARSSEAFDELVAMMAARRVTRIYDALVWGHPEAASGIIDAPIGRDQRDPMRMAVVVNGRAARTHYDTVSVYDIPEVTLLRCRLETGRTHQIRVHLSAVDHPVVGDATYGGARDGLDVPRPFLHAARLSFDHPVTGERLDLSSALPADLVAVLARCREIRR
jgi:23S rRNA pseudouridine1911/1915/1917 synthase